MLQEEHSAILLTFINLPVVIKNSVLSSFEWPFYTGLLYLSSLLSILVFWNEIVSDLKKIEDAFTLFPGQL